MMHFAILLRPALHGELGYWDEALNVIPLILGGALLIYLYLTGRRRQKDQKEHEDEG